MVKERESVGLDDWGGEVSMDMGSGGHGLITVHGESSGGCAMNGKSGSAHDDGQGLHCEG